MSSAIGKQTRLNSGFLHFLTISDHTMTIQNINHHNALNLQWL